MTYDQWKDPTDCSADDDSDWLSLVEVFEEWMPASVRESLITSEAVQTARELVH